MTLVRPTFVMAAIAGTFPARFELPLYGMQIVSRGRVTWAEKAAWFRNVPVTAVYPTPAQAEVRVRFGEMAKEAKARGEINKVSSRLGKWLPGAAAYIADHFHGFRATKERRVIAKKSIHTIEELKAYYGI